MYLLFPISIFIVGVLAVYGWVANIIKLIATLGDPSVTPLFIARIIGVPFFPVGSILGFF